MNRDQVIWGAWLMIDALDKRPSRRKINDLIRRVLGKGFGERVVRAWMLRYQHIDEHGRPYLKYVDEDGEE